MLWEGASVLDMGSLRVGSGDMTRIASPDPPRIGAATGLRFSAGTDVGASLRCKASRMRETVVIVDDNEAFRERTRTLLDAEGYRVIGEAGDGAGGLRLLQELRPDLALLDVQLPDTDGFTLAERAGTPDGATSIIIISTREATD